MRNSIISSVLLFVVAHSAQVLTAAPAKHVILSLADDLGYFDVGWTNPLIHSPTLTALANDGIQLERHYMYRFCSPSRSMLLAGVAAHRIGQQTDMNLNPVTSIQCAVQEKYEFLPKVLQANNFSTHMLGKWHLGHYKPKFTPTRRGFDTFVGFYAGDIGHMDTPYSSLFKSQKCACGARNSFTVSAQTCRRKTYCADPYQVVNNTATSFGRVQDNILTDYEFADEFFGDEAARIIREHDKAQGLFLYVAWASPHSPTASPESYAMMNANLTEALDMNSCLGKLRRKYAGMISALDVQHEKIISALKDTSMWDDTLLVFISDNGGHDEGSSRKMGDRCLDSSTKPPFSGRNYPLRGGKFTFWEGGIRSIGFVYSPSSTIIPASRRGSSYSGLFSGSDWAMTILQATGTDAPVGFGPDSISAWNEMINGSGAPRTQMAVQIFKEYGRYVLLYQHGESLFKYIEGYPGYIRAWGWGRYVKSQRQYSDPGDLITIPEELTESHPAFDHDVVSKAATSRHTCVRPFCLFDVTSDPSEMKNLINNPSYQTVLDEVRIALEKEKQEEVNFVGSGLCYPGDLRTQRMMKSNVVTDPHSIAISKFCSAMIPWISDAGIKEPLVESSCPESATESRSTELADCSSLQSKESCNSERKTSACAWYYGVCVDTTDCTSYNRIRNRWRRRSYCLSRSDICSFSSWQCKTKA